MPAFIHISNGKMRDVNALDLISYEHGAYYVFDRGYVDFERLHTLHRAGIARRSRSAGGALGVPRDRSGLH